MISLERWRRYFRLGICRDEIACPKGHDLLNSWMAAKVVNIEAITEIQEKENCPIFDQLYLKSRIAKNTVRSSSFSFALMKFCAPPVSKMISSLISLCVDHQKFDLEKATPKRIAKHARNHLKTLAARADETELKEDQLRQIAYRIQSIFDQLPGMREGLKRRAGTEARISIIIRDFMGKEPQKLEN